MSEWIKVEDELPIKPEDMTPRGYHTIHVFAYNGIDVFPAEFQCGNVTSYWYKFERKDGSSRGEFLVTHWLLPEPPQ